MRDVLHRMARAGRPPLNTLTPTAAKAAYETGAGVLEIPKPMLARVQDIHLPARDGYLLPARLYAPSAHCLPVLMYFHGGGFTIGSIATHDILCRQLSHLADCAVVSVDYRLAPEHRFPTAANDAWDALQWLATHAPTLGLDGTRLAVGGDSAGGTLAAMCAILARDAGLPLALQLLFYPGCTAHQDTPSHRRFAEGFVLGEAQISWFFNHYVRGPADRDDWRFAPLVDEGLLYADKLRAAGVPVDLEIYRGVTHEFIKMGRVLPEARQAHADAARALRASFKALSEGCT
jgi:acetyl esterase